MSKILVLSVSDNEEYILDKILTIMETGNRNETVYVGFIQGCNHISGVEIRLKERAVYRNEQLTYLTHREFAILTYFGTSPWLGIFCRADL